MTPISPSQHGQLSGVMRAWAQQHLEVLHIPLLKVEAILIKLDTYLTGVLHPARGADPLLQCAHYTAFDLLLMSCTPRQPNRWQFWHTFGLSLHLLLAEQLAFVHPAHSGKVASFQGSKAKKGKCLPPQGKAVGTHFIQRLWAWNARGNLRVPFCRWERISATPSEGCYRALARLRFSKHIKVQTTGKPDPWISSYWAQGPNPNVALLRQHQCRGKTAVGWGKQWLWSWEAR